MPDSLRDRIAAAIEECPMPVDGQRWSEILADAVIAELGLEPIQRTTMFPERRWVTPWELIEDE